MITVKNYKNKLQVEKRTVWLITILLSIAGFDWLKNIIVSILMKLYELIIQHALLL